MLLVCGKTSFPQKYGKINGISYILQVQSYYKISLKKINKAKQYKTLRLPRDFPRHAKIGGDEARHGKAFEGLLNRYFK